MPSQLKVAASLRASDGLGRVSAARLLALVSQGIHQAALGGVVLFSPESLATPALIVAGFAVLLGPYSLIGPFAAAALDRWDRRIVITVAMLARAAILVLTALAVLAGAARSTSGFALLFILALAAMGLGRLGNAGLTAVMPRVIPKPLIAGANAALVTAGALLGSGAAAATVATLALAGVENAVVATALGVAVACSLAAAGVIWALPSGHLGPAPGERSTHAPPTWQVFATGLSNGLAGARESSLTFISLVSITLGRAAFGVITLVGIVLLRAAAAEGDSVRVASIGGFALLTTSVVAGMGIAAIAAPWAIARWNHLLVVAGGAAIAATAQLIAGPTLVPTALVVGALFVGLGSQIVKLVGDFAMHTQVSDSHRGSVFALQDALFNSAFVVGMSACLPFISPDGRNAALMIGAGILYATAAAIAVGAWMTTRRKAL